MSDTNIPLPPTALAAPSIKIIRDPADIGAALAALKALKASESEKVEFKMFDDGSFFKYVPRKGFEPQALIVDAEGTQIAVARNLDISEFLCNACNCFVIAARMNQAGQETIVQPGSPIILPGGSTPPVVFES